jgi:hypothetical protein
METMSTRVANAMSVAVDQLWSDAPDANQYSIRTERQIKFKSKGNEKGNPCQFGKVTLIYMKINDI